MHCMLKYVAGRTADVDELGELDAWYVLWNMDGSDGLATEGYCMFGDIALVWNVPMLSAKSDI
jgi:hypothetical protein